MKFLRGSLSIWSEQQAICIGNGEGRMDHYWVRGRMSLLFCLEIWPNGRLQFVAASTFMRTVYVARVARLGLLIVIGKQVDR